MVDDPLLGHQLANFQIERPLGRGGMAQVYYGHDVKLNRPVAIKVIDARYRSNPLYARRFVQEAQTIARWRHEHIIQIYYADDQDGLYYYVMEYIEGQDLGEMIRRSSGQGELVSPTEVLRVSRAVAAALDYAHQHGVIHRDVKPSNVLIANDGRVVLTDFGLAMDVEQGSMGEVFGSAQYIAPEQARNSANAVPQSDLYALGIILYEMLTGRVPFDDPSSTAVALQHLTLPPPPPREINPELSPEIEQVLLKALSKSPKERYQTGYELIEALAHSLPESGGVTVPALSGSTQLTGVASSASTGPVSASRRPLIYGAVAAAVAIILFLFILLVNLLPGSEENGQGELALQTQLSTGEARPTATEVNVPVQETTNSGSPVASQTHVPDVVPNPTLHWEVSTPILESTIDFHLLIAKNGDAGLVLINMTAHSFPLAPLSLSNDKGLLNGVDWEVAVLENGTCVIASQEEGRNDEGKGKAKGQDKKGEDNGDKNKGQSYLPAGLNCREVGKFLTVKKDERFWKDTFYVHYAGAVVGACDKQEKACSVTIPVTSQ